MEHLRGVPEGDVDRPQLRRRSPSPPFGRRCLHEEVEQRRLLPGRRHQHVAPAPSPVNRGSATNEVEHRPDRGVDRVAPFAQHPRAGLRRQRVPGGDHPFSAALITER